MAVEDRHGRRCAEGAAEKESGDVQHRANDAPHPRRRALRHLVSRLFENSPSLLVLNVLDDDRIDPAELKRLKKLIEDA